jgi:hypothetical protein
VTIHAVYVHFYPEERQALSFDTGVTDLGAWRVKSLSELEFEIETLGVVSWKLFSDIPGGAMAQRTTGTIAHVAGRRTVLVATAAEGRRFRLVASASQPFRLYGLRFRIKPIGEYIDGAAGDFWESEEIALGN